MSALCYVCGSAELAEGYDPHNATCPDHVAARDHGISMQTNTMVCGCGWQILGYYPPLERDRLCRIHWQSACSGAVLPGGTT